eukprot:10920877-Alexandrium_andersonii.AAC.1
MAGGYKFACPRCGTWRRPFAAAMADRLACNMAWLVRVTEGTHLSQAVDPNEVYEARSLSRRSCGPTP